VVRPAITETTALGAAYLAGLTTGVFSGANELAGLWRVERRFEPQLAPRQAQALMERWEQAVRQAIA
jgi:glycerol kinase